MSDLGQISGSLAELHELETVLEAHGAGVCERRVLAQGEPGGDVGLVDGVVSALCPELLERGHAGDEDGRLADGRAVQLLGRPLGADLQEVVPEDVRGLLEELLGLGHLRADVLRHADSLGSLSREEERRLGDVAVELLIGVGTIHCSAHDGRLPANVDPRDAAFPVASGLA